MYVKKFAFVGGRDYSALASGVLHAPTWHSQFTPIWAPEGCSVASSATLLSIKNKSFNMYYAYSHLPQSGGVFSMASFGGLLAASTLTSYMKRFDSGFTNIPSARRFLRSGRNPTSTGRTLSTLPSLPTKPLRNTASISFSPRRSSRSARSKPPRATIHGPEQPPLVATPSRLST